jgi:hypothetical protein
VKNGVLLASLALAAALVGWLVSPAVGVAQRTRSVLPERDPVLLRIREGVEAIAARLTRLEGSALAGGESDPRTMSVRGERDSPSQAIADLANDVREVREVLAAVDDRLRALDTRIPLAPRSMSRPPEARLAGMLRDRPTTEWAAWEEVAELWRVDADRARRSLLFSTPRELLERFGEPTRIRSEDQGEVQWIYRRPADGGPTLQATVAMLDGYVTGLDVRLP